MVKRKGSTHNESRRQNFDACFHSVPLCRGAYVFQLVGGRVKRFVFAIICVVVVAASFLAQAQPGKLARLIQDGKRAAALDMIRRAPT